MRGLTDDDTALAMELRSEGIEWRHIATGLGCCINTVRKYVKTAPETGYRKAPEAIQCRLRLHYVQSRAAAILAADTRTLAPYGAVPCPELDEAQRWRELGLGMVGE